MGYPWIFYVVIFFAFASITSILFINPQEINHHIARELSEEKTIPISTEQPIPILLLLKRKSVIIFSLSLILYYIGNAAQIALLGQLLVQKNPHSEFFYISGSMIVAEFVMVAMAFGISFIIDRAGRKPFILTAFMIVSLRALLFTFAQNSHELLIIQVLDGMAAGIVGIMFTVITSDIALGTGRFNFLLGFFNVSLSIGAALSNILAGFIVNCFGFDNGFFFLSAVAVFGGLFFVLFMPETNHK